MPGVQMQKQRHVIQQLCYQFAFPALWEADKERQRQEMQAEIDQLKSEVKDLKGELESIHIG